MFQDYEKTPSEIIPNLFISDAVSASDKKFIDSHNIKRIVNCTPNIPNYWESSGIQYFRVPVYDISSDIEIMKKYILDAINFMYRPSKENAVLVHCAAGVSRSCTITAAYLRYFHCDNLMDAINKIVEKRPIAFYFGKKIIFLPALKKIFNN
jgi:protein-tyrosine phosphatase